MNYSREIAGLFFQLLQGKQTFGLELNLRLEFSFRDFSEYFPTVFKKQDYTSKRGNILFSIHLAVSFFLSFFSEEFDQLNGIPSKSSHI
jgi:hypothetical protein